MGAQREPSTYERQLVALGRVLQSLREAESAEQLVEIALGYLQSEFSYALTWIGLYDRVEHRLIGQGGSTPTGDLSFLKQRLVLNPGDLLEQVVIQQRLVGVPDLREEPRAGEWRKAAQTFNIQGTIIFPIRYKEQCFGVTLLGSTLWGVSPHSEEKARLSMVLGELGAALYQADVEQQRQQTKRPDEPLLTLLAQLRSFTSLGQRLAAIAQQTQAFVQSDRTNIYWFEPERRYFWRRIGTRDSIETPGINVQEVNSFYQALAADQLVSIGEAHSSLKADITGRLMQQLGARSLLAAPILFQNELLGFLAVEGTEPRIWSEEEKSYVRGAAQLVALTAPLEAMEENIQRAKQDQLLTAEIARAIYSDDDWRNTLNHCALELCSRLRAERFLVLLYDQDLERFEICYQSQPNSRRPIASFLEGLNQVDWQMLERSTEAVGVENLEDDLKLMAWREVFLDLGVQSLLVCSTAINHPLEGLVVIGHEATRTWNRSERDLLRIVSQQIGLILHQWQLQRQTDQQQKTYQTIQWGLTTMQQTHDLELLERSAMEHISQVLQVPLATLITWQPGRKTARIVAPVITKSQFALNADVQISVYTDTLIQWALHNDDLLTLSVDDLAVETRQWLSGSGIGQILAMTLRTAPDHEPTGIVLVADHRDRYWGERQLNALGTLVSQLAWSRRYVTLTEMLSARKATLEQLNWYKQHRLEEMYRTLNVAVRRLNELGQHKESAASMRYQQILRHLGGLLTAMSPVLKLEAWQFRHEIETAPLVSLLKRSLERVDGLVKQRQIWTQVHNDANLSIEGDIPKIELVLCELLTVACHRSPPNSRLDIWCRPLDHRWLEISITDNGVIESRLLEELQSGRSIDLLTPSMLNHPPGLHLAICKSLMQQINGEFNLYRLDDGRILSRLIVPIAPTIPAPPTRIQIEEVRDRDLSSSQPM
ncbi:GAF domain-containing protein [Microcoleus sp. FACHB-1515]|uniref:sensor histidine kinase n=1 Tax=Cyanophyceae TaxID=3028117 RepID=UPI001689EAA6|nr:GAF domain-containing protein [Microcoleus sp. FACHB-1515]MBD2092207.1 GAF domain-containing protein [Microcoleus sp. FACHB-1515]